MNLQKNKIMQTTQEDLFLFYKGNKTKFTYNQVNSIDFGYHTWYTEINEFGYYLELVGPKLDFVPDSSNDDGYSVYIYPLDDFFSTTENANSAQEAFEKTISNFENNIIKANKFLSKLSGKE